MSRNSVVRPWTVLIAGILLAVISGCQADGREETWSFVHAIERGDVTRVRVMLDKDPMLIKDASVDRGDDEKTALRAALDSPAGDRESLLAILLNAGADPNEIYRDVSDRVLLDLEAMGDRPGLVTDLADLRLLLDAGIREDLKEESLLNIQREQAELWISQMRSTVHQGWIQRQRAKWDYVDLVLRHYWEGWDGRSPSWMWPAGLAANRLRSHSEPSDFYELLHYEEEYKVPCESPAGPMLFLIRIHHAKFASWASIAIVDTRLNLRGVGIADLPKGIPVRDAIPYTVVEVRSQDPGWPAYMRGCWMPAIAWWNPKFDASRPIRFIGKAAPEANVMPCTLVQWVDLPKENGQLKLDLRELKDLEIRAGELDSPDAFEFEGSTSDADSK